MKFFFDKIEFGSKSKMILGAFDQYSYEFYLVHQFLILGPFSLMAVTSIIGINIIIILLGIMILGCLLKYVDTTADGFLKINKYE